MFFAGVENSEDFISRVKFCIKIGGGPSEVARKSGIPLGSLNHYISGREMKVGAAAAVAKACGVSLVWLATGEGEPMPGAERERPGFSPEQLSSTANFRALAMVLIACKEFHDRSGLTPTLAEAIDWAAKVYTQYKTIADGPIKLAPFDDD